MSMTQTERLALREIAREIVVEIGPDIAEKAAWKVIDKHVDTCPVAAKMENSIQIVKLESKVTYLKLVILALLCGASGGGVLALAQRVLALI